ncbi:MAG: hypothetical protein JWO71_1923 [Candidatus Acidoferrum typicum]|nr:hypothetical protein [Candidatus Acidoferrum typicum]
MSSPVLRYRRSVAILIVIILGFAASFASYVFAQQTTAPANAPSPAAKANAADFALAADEVLAQMSQITGLPLRAPLKKSLRSRQEIHAHIIQEMNDDKDAAERYAGARSAEAFGLLPKGFDLDSFMIDLLTEQIAGLYDPKAHEFYVADWIPVDDQRMVMAHELTHALEDQHFQIEAWAKAARPNDDGELARESVLEGSAMVAMVEYLLQGSGRSLQDLPDIDPAMLIGDMADTPLLKKAPPFLKDALIFPYLDGLTFSAAILKPTGWEGLSRIFTKPPVSTQQILHPALYTSGKVPAAVALPSMEKALGADWIKLEENVMGEFGWKEVLKQFIGEPRAKPLSAAWDGDRYAVYEQKQTKHLLLITRERLVTQEQAERFLGQYSEALEKKYDTRSNLFRKPDFFSFDTPDGGVFLRCFETDCVTLEGGDRALFLRLNKELNWPAVPEPPKVLEKSAKEIAKRSQPYRSNELTLENGRLNDFASRVTPPVEGQEGSGRPLALSHR